MRAMRLETVGQPLKFSELPIPQPGPGEVLVKVSACAVCRTDLHVVDGELPHAKLPLVPGHEIVGRIVARGTGAERFAIGARVGIPWLGHTCGVCSYCLSGRENLCDEPRFTGYQFDGGFATHVIADADFCFEIPRCYDDAHAAPLLCAGLIGYRSLVATGPATKLGIFGFGAAAHIVAQIARFEERRVFAFTRPEDRQAQDFARSLGCEWAGGTNLEPPEALDAAIIFAPVGDLVPIALSHIVKGGTLVLGGIYMSRVPSMPYSLLWGERVIRSVANLTRADGEAFLALAGRVPLKIAIETFPLEQANEALAHVRDGNLSGAAVLLP